MESVKAYCAIKFGAVSISIILIVLAARLIHVNMAAERLKVGSVSVPLAFNSAFQDRFSVFCFFLFVFLGPFFGNDVEIPLRIIDFDIG